MPWFLIWTFLVLVALALWFFLGREVVRKARAVLEEFERAGEVLDDLTERSNELTELLQRVEVARSAEKPEFTDSVAAQRNMAAVRQTRRRKKVERQLKHNAKRRTWPDLATDPRFDRWRKK